MTQTIKAEVIDLIQHMPENATIEDIMAELYVRNKIEEGLAQLEAGDLIEHEAVKQKLAKWLD